MNKKIIVVALTCALAGASGVALAGGDAAAGKAKAAMCASCHAPDGNSVVPTFPKLAGQHEAYLVDALKQYRSGARDNAMMKPLVAALTDTDIANLAAFFATQKPK